MYSKRKKIVERFIKESHFKNDEFFINHLTDDIKWNIVGMPEIIGKHKFLEAIKILELWQPSVHIKNIIAEGDFVVVESSGRNITNSFCDIFHFADEKIRGLTTYIVDITINE